MGTQVASGLSLFGVGDRASSRRTTNTSETNQDYTKTLGENTAAGKTAGAVSTDQLAGLSDQLNNFFNNASKNSQDADQLFKGLLTQFATGSGNPSPDQMKAATDYVDQTFSAPAQTQYNRFLDQAQNQIASRAAQMGRSSNDVGYQREFAGQASNAAQDLSNQRGSLIAQRASDLQNQQLSTALTGAQYFNTPLNQAFSNRLSLLNSATGAGNLGLNSQIASGGYKMNTTGSGLNEGPKPDLATKMGAFGTELDNGLGKMASIYSMGMGG